MECASSEEDSLKCVNERIESVKSWKLLEMNQSREDETGGEILMGQ